MKEQDTRDAILRDLDLQWKDHFHMRDQTWKTLTNAALLFLGVVGLEIKDAGHIVMIPAYIVLIVTTMIGWTVAAHHRVRQGQKFKFIKLYEEKLGLYDLKKEIIQKADAKTGIPGKIFTARFIEIMHLSIGIVAAFLLATRIIVILASNSA